jgi:histone H3/H4
MPQFGEPSGTFRFSPPPIDAAAPSPIVEQAETLNAGMDIPEPVGDISDREPMEDVSDRSPLEDISAQGPEDLLDQEAIGDISDREPIEDISDRSDEGAIPMGDAFSDHGVVVEVTAPQRQEIPTRREAMPPRKKNRISRHGIEYPSLPPAFVKRVAQTALQSSGLSNPRISADTLTALTQASDWFFEQLGDDLGAYANHAKRKTVEESDVVTLMRRFVYPGLSIPIPFPGSMLNISYRQRQIDSTSTMFSLAQKHLPRELLQELRMPVPQPTKKRRAKRPREDDEAEEVT